MRRRYLVTYDVSDDKRRTKVFRSLLDHGDHAQYSVFFCELNSRELAELRGRICANIHHGEDQVLILDLGDVSNPLDAGLECLGKAYDPALRTMIV
jgi:CRISPR-associated protein Cas2